MRRLAVAGLACDVSKPLGLPGRAGNRGPLRRPNVTVPSMASVLSTLRAALRPWREREYERRFARDCFGCFRGVYRSFEEANLSAPASKPAGFDSASYAAEFADRRERVLSFDYPMLFWLRELLREGCVLFDFGGHVGTHFYSYSRYISYPPGMRWVVYELPAIRKAGEELARERGRGMLEFRSNVADADGADILVAAGSVQYVESPPLAEMLSALARKPAHLLLNKLPLYDGPQFVTLQNGSVAFHPQYVFNRTEFVTALTALGYRLRDQWSVETHPGLIPFHPERSFPFHSGLYMMLDATVPAGRA